MQGLLRNPLADGSTLGVSAGASLGAVLALALGFQIPGLRYGATMLSAMFFAFLSLLLILSLAYLLDKTLETTSIILIGVIFSMFASSVMSLIITFAGERIRSITFWTMGSLSGSTYVQAIILCAALILCYAILRLHAAQSRIKHAEHHGHVREDQIRDKRDKVPLELLAGKIQAVERDGESGQHREGKRGDGGHVNPALPDDGAEDIEHKVNQKPEVVGRKHDAYGTRERFQTPLLLGTCAEQQEELRRDKCFGKNHRHHHEGDQVPGLILGKQRHVCCHAHFRYSFLLSKFQIRLRSLPGFGQRSVP
jgi:uncharacterized membrane protein